MVSEPQGDDLDILSKYMNDLRIEAETEQNEPDNLKSFKNQFHRYLRESSTFLQIKSIEQTEKTLIILSPLSTKHHFGRNWSTKQEKSSIVERPERLLAASIGISAALTMYPQHFSISTSRATGSLHSPHVTRIHGTKWIEYLERLLNESDEKLNRSEIEVPDGWPKGDLYFTKETLVALGGVISTIQSAVDTIFDDEKPNRAFLLIRPPGHHSHPCSPSGFCFINNAHIAIEYSGQKEGVTHAVILDIDLHHGDGSQDICYDRAGFEPDFGESEENLGEKAESEDLKNKEAQDKLPEVPYDNTPEERTPKTPKVGYFSIHDINSFPTELGQASLNDIKNASVCISSHDLNIWNVHLEPYSTEEEFHQHYSNKYSAILRKAEEFFIKSRLSHERERMTNESLPPFKALVVVSAGFDASEYEDPRMQRHGVHVPTSFYAKFGADAVNLANSYSDGHLISVLEGGYSDGALTSGIFAHLCGLQGQKFLTEWGSKEVNKELVKLCRSSWKPLQTPASTPLKHWANQVGLIGRTLFPEFTLKQANNDIVSKPRQTRSQTKNSSAESNGSSTAISRSSSEVIQVKMESNQANDIKKQE
ncbi:hypothetical protein WICMUC_005897 [Wickerhamomyces mucosus]|uniref:Histone deacetylase domain-containing protein n=1 Tax=Wickerhamomyces mucosus TaxID=1378264 RepID=A0A9P8P2D2_9ASCO|nr:hypothetical protein WICMUC_005897 [Wickerhamomyces mucosus]